MRIFNFFILFLFLTIFSCDFFKKTDEKPPIARVNETYLYYDDVKHLVIDGLSKEDSTLVVRNFIKKWATQQLFVDGAMLNLGEAKQEAFNKLVEEYKNYLYTQAYKEALVIRGIDTIISIKETKKYHKNNKELFKLNEEIIKFRYLYLEKKIIDHNKIKKKFKRYNLKDKSELDSMAVQFKSYSFNDSTWVKLSEVIKKIPPIKLENKNQLLKKSNFIQLKDSLGVYLIKINDVLLRNNPPPLDYIKPIIDQIIINKRKLKLVRELEKDITKDAFKNRQFEIYN